MEPILTSLLTAGEKCLKVNGAQQIWRNFGGNCAAPRLVHLEGIEVAFLKGSTGATVDVRGLQWWQLNETPEDSRPLLEALVWCCT